MKPVLVIGLGNPLMGDDGVGCVVAERLADDPRLPECVEVVCGGADLLRCSARMEGRTRVLVVDALEGGAETGSVFVLDPADRSLDDCRIHAHYLSAVQAIRLLETLMPLRCTLIGIGIDSAAAGNGLSPSIGTRMPSILECVLEEVGRYVPDFRCSGADTGPGLDRLRYLAGDADLGEISRDPGRGVSSHR